MRFKIFRCRFCGANVAWSDTSCSVCHRLVSNDWAKRGIIITGILAFIILIIILLFALM